MDDLYTESITFDGLMPPQFRLLPGGIAEGINLIRASGLTAGNVTLGGRSPRGPYDGLIKSVANWNTWSTKYSDALLLARTASDIDRAKREGKFAVIFGVQNGDWIESDVERVDILHALGLRILQPTYNSRNLLGDGCAERTNAGLSDLGVAVVKRMNELGMLLDLSHCGDATTLDGLSTATLPVLFTHSSAKSIYPHPRGKTDQAIKLMAETGGVMGIYAVPWFLCGKPAVTMDDFIDHIAYVADRVGIKHVGIGTDWFITRTEEQFEESNRAGAGMTYEMLKRNIPADILMLPEVYERRWMMFIPGIETISGWPNIVPALRKRGFADEDIQKVIGGNFMRVFRQVCP
jgi:membrane dipeptidase